MIQIQVAFDRLFNVLRGIARERITKKRCITVKKYCCGTQEGIDD